METNQNCPTNLSTFPQSRAPKDEESTSMESKNIKDGILTCWSELKYQKRKQKATKSGLREKEPQAFVFSLLNEGGKFLDAKNVPLPRFYNLGAGVARPGELTCYFFFFYGNINHVPSSLTG